MLSRNWGGCVVKDGFYETMNSLLSLTRPIIRDALRISQPVESIEAIPYCKHRAQLSYLGMYVKSHPSCPAVTYE